MFFLSWRPEKKDGFPALNISISGRWEKRIKVPIRQEVSEGDFLRLSSIPLTMMTFF